MMITNLPRKLLCLSAVICFSTGTLADHHGDDHASSIKMIDSSLFGIDQSEIQGIRVFSRQVHRDL